MPQAFTPAEVQRYAAAVPTVSIGDPNDPSTVLGPLIRESDAVRGQSLRHLLELLNSLDDDKRDALVSVDIEGMSVPEACMALEVNLNTLYSRLRAARRQMRQRLAPDNLGGWRQP